VTPRRSSHALLGHAIDPTVTVYINQLREMDPPIRDTVLHSWREDAAGLTEVHDHPELHTGKTKAQTARIYDQLARGLAADAHRPGGVTFAGRHWCTQPHPDCPNRTPDAPVEPL
jgi:hypothetical protein